MDFKVKLQELEKQFNAKQQQINEQKSKLEQLANEAIELRGAYKYVESLLAESSTKPE